LSFCSPREAAYRAPFGISRSGDSPLPALSPCHQSPLTLFHFFQTDTTNLKADSKLAGSELLSALSQVSGTDFVGTGDVKDRLGLAQDYFVNLLNLCTSSFDGAIECSPARFGPQFNPGADMKLDNTMLAGVADSAYDDAFARYSKVASYLPIAYVVSVLLLGLSVPLGLFGNSKWIVIVFTGFTFISVVLLVSAGTLAAFVFKALASAINSNFGDNGLKATVGWTGLNVGYVAMIVAFLSLLLASTRACMRPERKHRSRGALITGAGHPNQVSGDDGIKMLGGPTGKAGRVATFVKERMPTFSRQKYVQVEKQAAIVRTEPVWREHSAHVEGVPAPKHHMDPDWDGDDEFVAGGNHDNAETSGGSIPMKAMVGQKRIQDVSTAYEPFRGPTPEQPIGGAT